MAGRGSEERWSIEKLDGSNWSTRKFQMKHLLLAKGLGDIAEGTRTLAAQYFLAEMEEGTKMETHLRQMKELTDRLAAIGAPVGEDDQVATLLGSLPEGYSTLVTALEAQVDDVQLDLVQQAVIGRRRKSPIA